MVTDSARPCARHDHQRRPQHFSGRSRGGAAAERSGPRCGRGWMRGCEWGETPAAFVICMSTPRLPRPSGTWPTRDWPNISGFEGDPHRARFSAQHAGQGPEERTVHRSPATTRSGDRKSRARHRLRAWHRRRNRAEARQRRRAAGDQRPSMPRRATEVATEIRQVAAKRSRSMGDVASRGFAERFVGARSMDLRRPRHHRQQRRLHLGLDDPEDDRRAVAGHARRPSGRRHSASCAPPPSRSGSWRKKEAEAGREVFRKVVNISRSRESTATRGRPTTRRQGRLVGLTRTMCKEWGRYKVNVNASPSALSRRGWRSRRSEPETIDVGGVISRSEYTGEPRADARGFPWLPWNAEEAAAASSAVHSGVRWNVSGHNCCGGRACEQA